MSKIPRKVYIYKDANFINETSSIMDASRVTKINQCTIRQRLNIPPKPTKNGWVFSPIKLTEEQIQNIPIHSDVIKTTKQQKKRDNARIKTIGGQEFKLTQFSNDICYLGKSRKERVQMLRNYLQNALQYKWRNQPKQVTTVEREFVNGLLRKLE